MATVALVLGAGGTVGHSFHVGALSALADEFGWDARSADLIVGTSAGSVVGASLRAGLSALNMRRRAFGQTLSPAGAVLARRGEVAMAAARADGAGDAEPVATQRRLRIGSPERVLRAMREPWKVTPGSLFSALVPPGRLPTGYLGAVYDDLLGDEWPARDLWIAAVNLDIGHRVVFGRFGSPAATLGQAVEGHVRSPATSLPSRSMTLVTSTAGCTPPPTPMSSPSSSPSPSSPSSVHRCRPSVRRWRCHRRGQGHDSRYGSWPGDRSRARPGCCASGASK